ncbi:MAG: glucosidase [Candidatus Sumerlaeia bacterium]|nr:glucosidase [Candidatus Sumerlaeia bacterium]
MASNPHPTIEHQRLAEDARREQNWKRWGPYLSERQWGTVREDYSADGDCWRYFPHEHARSRAYRWGEDGLLGICDRQCRLAFALALWNHRDPILKERLFGLTGPQGNHGEDVKECYYYLDSTPTHSYLRALYKYPQAEFPYDRLVAENARRTKHEPEFELEDTGIFDGGRFFDVQVEYAKNSPDDILIRIEVSNRGTEPAPLLLLPTLWFRNTWTWKCTHEGCAIEGRMRRLDDGLLEATHQTLGKYRLAAEEAPGFVFTNNETNLERLYDVPNAGPFVKDAFHDHFVHGRAEAVNSRGTGTKAAAVYRLEVAPHTTRVVRLRLCLADTMPSKPFADFDSIVEARRAEADAFHVAIAPPHLNDDERAVMRQAYAGLLWTKQFYHYVVADWLKGDPGQPVPPPERLAGRNRDWPHLFNRDIISMPDKWEYPWYAAWDLAFHMVPFAVVDPDFAKSQLQLFLREWYMHPNGQIPAYEFNFSDVNPPVHAWAAWRVYKMTAPRGERDRVFLSRVFQKLLMNFTWWVNRKDPSGNHVFSGGFLGLDNIGVFDRSQDLPTGGHLHQADATAWMAFYCTEMLAISLELAEYDPACEDTASKFFEHFTAIADAINTFGGSGLWDDEDGFYYDQIHLDGCTIPLKVRSLVGLIPLLAVGILEDRVIARLHGFRHRLEWFLANRGDLAGQIAFMNADCPDGGRNVLRLLAIPSRDKLERILVRLLDENEFLSPFGIRSLSKAHEREPYVFEHAGARFEIRYQPGESDSHMFGGNSNWRGPVWFPINYLIVEALERYHHFYGDALRVECPTGSGRLMNLLEVSQEISSRLCTLFRRDATGARPAHGADRRYADDPHWRDLLLFHEYFHAETGRGLGASHQTGWTALVARLLRKCHGERSAYPQSLEQLPKLTKDDLRIP